MSGWFTVLFRRGNPKQQGPGTPVRNPATTNNAAAAAQPSEAAKNVELARARARAVRDRLQAELQKLAEAPLRDVTKYQTPARPKRSVPQLKFSVDDDDDFESDDSSGGTSPMHFIPYTQAFGNHAAGSEMLWDEDQKEWRGNHADLMPFATDSTLAPSTKTPMGRITNLTAVYGSHQHVIDKSGMRLDPHTLKWVSASGDNSDDVFANMESPRAQSTANANDPNKQIDPEIVKKQFTIPVEELQQLTRIVSALNNTSTDTAAKCLRTVSTLGVEAALTTKEQYFTLRPLIMDQLVNLANGASVVSLGTAPAATKSATVKIVAPKNTKLSRFKEEYIPPNGEFGDSFLGDSEAMLRNKFGSSNSPHSRSPSSQSSTPPPMATSTQPATHFSQGNLADETDGLDVGEQTNLGLKLKLNLVSQAQNASDDEFDEKDW